jgi:hypothetical protein
MNEPIEVVRANILEDGVIVSESMALTGVLGLGLRAVVFGSRPNTLRHRPYAIVVDGVNGIELLGRAHHDLARQHGQDIL